MRTTARPSPTLSREARNAMRVLSVSACKDLVEALSHRFPTAYEVYRLLHSFRRHNLHLPDSACGGIRMEPATLPTAGSWYLFAPGARLRGDGHEFVKRVHKKFLITREQHVLLTVYSADGTSSFPALRGYCATTEETPALLRRIFWLLDSEWQSVSGKAPLSAVRRGGTGGEADSVAVANMRRLPVLENDGTLDTCVRGVAFVQYLHAPDPFRAPDPPKPMVVDANARRSPRIILPPPPPLLPTGLSLPPPSASRQKTAAPALTTTTSAPKPTPATATATTST